MVEKSRPELKTVDGHHHRVVGRQRLVDCKGEIVADIALQDALAMRVPGEGRAWSQQRQDSRESHRIWDAESAKPLGASRENPDRNQQRRRRREEIAEIVLYEDHCHEVQRKKDKPALTGWPSMARSTNRLTTKCRS
jgi:hypothetical protein